MRLINRHFYEFNYVVYSHELSHFMDPNYHLRDSERNLAECCDDDADGLEEPLQMLTVMQGDGSFERDRSSQGTLTNAITAVGR